MGAPASMLKRRVTHVSHPLACALPPSHDSHCPHFVIAAHYRYCPTIMALAAECAPKEAFAAYGALLLCVLLPHIGEGFLRAAVVAYAAVLAAMGAVACGCARAADEAAGGRPEAASAARLGAWGSVLFVASDSLLAIDRFVAPLPMARWAVMTTYLAAQALLADSFALAPPR